jgi:hypothetical protein
MRTELSGQIDQELTQKVAKVLELFIGHNVRVIIEENTGQERRPRVKQNG